MASSRMVDFTEFSVQVVFWAARIRYETGERRCASAKVAVMYNFLTAVKAAQVVGAVPAESPAEQTPQRALANKTHVVPHIRLHIHAHGLIDASTHAQCNKRMHICWNRCCR